MSDKPRMVWPVASGAFVVTLNGAHLALDDQPFIWTNDLSKARRYATAEDAQVIADYFWRAKAVAGGLATFEIAADGTLRPRIRVLAAP